MKNWREVPACHSGVFGGNEIVGRLRERSDLCQISSFSF